MSIHAVAPMDYDPVQIFDEVEFDECATRHCVNVAINNDVTLEQVESFYVTHAPEVLVRVNSELMLTIIDNVTKAEIKIVDDERKNLYSTCNAKHCG